MQGQQTDLDRSWTGQQRCFLLNYAPPGVSGKAYCLFNLNAFFSSHLFCWSNTLQCTTAQTLLLTARNKGRILFISLWVCPFSLWRTYERLQNVLFQVGNLLTGTFGHLFERFRVFPKKFSLLTVLNPVDIWNALTFRLNNAFQSFSPTTKQWKYFQTTIKWEFPQSLFCLRYGFIGFDGCDTINCLIF